MMVWGSIVSSDALAGAVSGSKAVPVTTTVSIPPALSAMAAWDVFAASCWAWATPCHNPPVNIATTAQWQNKADLADILETPEIQLTRGQATVFAPSHIRESTCTIP